MRRFLALFTVLAVLAACAPMLSTKSEAPSPDAPYRLDAGDQLRVTIFGQPDLTGSYAVDPTGHVALPLVGQVAARGHTTQEFAARVTTALQNGFLREPNVSVEVEQYRPFYILGEVNNPGAYAFVAGLTPQMAAAIAGGFTARAHTQDVDVMRTIAGEVHQGRLTMTAPVSPGDVLTVRIRYF
jgi:polysaccharide export outer membrane protein